MKRTKLKFIDWRVVAVGLLVSVFTVIPIVHVATFTGGFEPSGYEWLGYIYAIGLDLGIATCAWFMRWKTTRIMALVSYFIFVMVDGSFNVAYVEPWKSSNTLAAWLYAIFPTLIVSILSILAAMVGKLSAKGNRVSAGDAITKAIAKRLGLNETESEAEGVTTDEVETTIEQPEPEVKPIKPRIHHWRSIRAKLNGNGDNLSTEDVQKLLIDNGFLRAPESTARRWANE